MAFLATDFNEPLTVKMLQERFSDRAGEFELLRNPFGGAISVGVDSLQREVCKELEIKSCISDCFRKWRHK